MLTSRPLALLIALAAAAGCRSEPSPAPADTPNTQEKPGDFGEVPPLARLLVADLTSPDQRPVDLALEADTQLRTALHAPGHFGAAAADDDAACNAQFQIFYAVLVNGESAPAATAGDARIGVEGAVQCPDPTSPHRAVEAFRISEEAGRPFGAEHGGTGPETLRALLGELAPQLAARLVGQVVMRHAPDARVLAVLAGETRPGLLMEAASEAGERKLSAAVPDLVRLTAADDHVVSLRATAALGLIRDSRHEVLAALARMTEGSDTERHLTALNALGDIGGEEAARYLDALAVGHPLVPIRDAARLAAERARGVRHQAAPSPEDPVE